MSKRKVMHQQNRTGPLATERANPPLPVAANPQTPVVSLARAAARANGEPGRLPARLGQIDQEFRSLGPPHSAAEHSNLEVRLRADGRCFDRIIAWQNTILDGHNRYEACVKWGIPYDVLDIDLPDREAAKAWIAAHQLDKRNLIGLGLNWMQAVRYHLEKNRPGGNGAKQHAAELTDQTDRFARATDERLAREFHCGPATIRRNAGLIKYMDQIVAKGARAPRGGPVARQRLQACRRPVACRPGSQGAGRLFDRAA